MPAKPKHRDRIVDAAIKLFRRRGYSASGLNDIVAESGAPKGSLYYYFPKGKASIAAAAVEEAGNRVVATMRELSSQAQTTAELLRSHARLLARWMEKSGFRDGCPITTVLLEMTPDDRSVTAAGRKAMAARHALLTDSLIADGFDPSKARNLAVLCASAIQGALVHVRVERSPKPLHIVADELAEMLAQAKCG